MGKKLQKQNKGTMIHAEDLDTILREEGYIKKNDICVYVAKVLLMSVWVSYIYCCLNTLDKLLNPMPVYNEFMLFLLVFILFICSLVGWICTFVTGKFICEI